MKQNKRKLFIIVACALVITLSMTLFVSFSLDTDVQKVIVKSMSALYDEESTIVVEDGKTTFNDKDQEVKYKVVLENTQSNPVKLEDIKLSTPSEDFLVYEIEDFNKGDLINGNSTKEIVVSFVTEKKDGWGRNFDDELTASLTFSSSSKKEETKPVVKPDAKPEKEDKPSEDIEVPDDDLTNNVEIEEEQEELEEVIIDIKEEVKEEKNDYCKLILLIILIILDIVFGTILIIKIRNRKGKIIGLVIIGLFSSIAIVNADELIEVPIKFNIAFKSQNVMKAAYSLDDTGNKIFGEYWFYRQYIENIYIQNEFIELTDYKFKYDVSLNQNDRVLAYLKKSGTIREQVGPSEWADVDVYDLYLQADGVIYFNEDASYYFYLMQILETLNNIEGIDTSNVTNMSYMFQYTGRIRDVFTLDVSHFDTSKVTDMSSMFEQTGRNTENFTLDVSNFDTSNVTDMSYMFAYLGESNSDFTLDVSNFDTSNVTNMSRMFWNTGSNSKVFMLDVSNFDTSNVTDMSYMFSGTGCSSENFFLDVSNFDTSNVTDMSNMFYYAGYDNENFTLDVSNFDTSKVTNYYEMFSFVGYNSTKLNTSITIKNPDLITMGNPNLTPYSFMFEDVATKEGAKLTVNFTRDTEFLVDKMILTKSSDSNVVKGNCVDCGEGYIPIGTEIDIKGEKFNVIGQTDDTVTMLAQYNLGTDYKQSTIENGVLFSDNDGWEYTPGPLEIDIQEWSTNPKIYVNSYIEYLKGGSGDDVAVGGLISLKDLGTLGCSVSSDYTYVGNFDYSCKNSPYKSWLVNNQDWWTRSATTKENLVWYVGDDGYLSGGVYKYTFITVRPVITISKESLKNYLEK